MMLRKIERLGEQDIDKENKLVFKMNSWCYPEILEKHQHIYKSIRNTGKLVFDRYS